MEWSGVEWSGAEWCGMVWCGVCLPEDIHHGTAHSIVDVLGPTRRHCGEVQADARFVHQEHEQQPNKRRDETAAHHI